MTLGSLCIYQNLKRSLKSRTLTLIQLTPCPMTYFLSISTLDPFLNLKTFWSNQNKSKKQMSWLKISTLVKIKVPVVSLQSSRNQTSIFLLTIPSEPLLLILTCQQKQAMYCQRCHRYCITNQFNCQD